jgi:hypothetical protein
MEDEGKVNLSVRMKKKALQGALEAAAKKKKARAGLQAPPLALADCSMPEVCLCRGRFTEKQHRALRQGLARLCETLPYSRRDQTKHYSNSRGAPTPLRPRQTGPRAGVRRARRRRTRTSCSRRRS